MRARNKVLALMFALTVITYLDRVCISATAGVMSEELGLTKVQMGQVFSIFILGYVLFEIPGGWLADRLRRTSPVGRLYVGLLAAIPPVPLALWMLSTDNITLIYVINFPLSVFTSMWIGAGASTVQDLVLPRMRAVASAVYLLVITFIGLALGPYTIGQLSDVLGDLPMAMRIALAANGAAVLFLVLATRHLARDEETLIDRARASGEPGL